MELSSDSNGIRIRNYLVCKQTLNHLVKNFQSGTLLPQASKTLTIQGKTCKT